MIPDEINGWRMSSFVQLVQIAVAADGDYQKKYRAVY